MCAAELVDGVSVCVVCVVRVVCVVCVVRVVCVSPGYDWAGEQSEELPAPMM